MQGIKTIGPAIEQMAEAEELQAHKNAVTLRLNDLKNESKERILHWARPEIVALKPYQSARQEFIGNGQEMILLDANESPFQFKG